MRHRIAGRTLNRNASHRKAMFMNMATSFILTLRDTEAGEVGAAKVKGRIVTTIPKAKELRPRIEKLITLAKRALPLQEKAIPFATQAARNTAEWKAWRESDQWRKWAQAMAPFVEARRRAFAVLRNKEAVNLLFSDLAPRFMTRNGGYTRIVKLAKFRVGDATRHCFIEFVGTEGRDRVKVRRARPVESLQVTPAVTVPETPVAETPAVSDTPAASN